ncbi:MAG: hypothetical protein ABI835_15245, partial [Chloroflexota bacterium]
MAMPIEQDVRTLRQVEFLSPQYNITLIGYGNPTGLPQNVTWKPIQRSANRLRRLYEIALLALGRVVPAAYDIYLSTRPHYRQTVRYATDSQANVYHACDWAAIALCAQAAKIHPAPIFFDGDEYWTLENESSRSWRMVFAPLIRHTMNKYVGSIAAATTLSPPFVELYQKEYHLDTEIMLCVPSYVEVPVRLTKPDHIVLMHHGAARRNRYLETMIEALSKLDSRFHLVFML